MNDSYGLSMTKGRVADARRYVREKKKRNPLSSFTLPPRSKKQRIRLKHQKRVRRYIDHVRAFLRESGIVSPPAVRTERKSA